MWGISYFDMGSYVEPQKGGFHFGPPLNQNPNGLPRRKRGTDRRCLFQTSLHVQVGPAAQSWLQHVGPEQPRPQAPKLRRRGVVGEWIRSIHRDGFSTAHVLLCLLVWIGSVGRCTRIPEHSLTVLQASSRRGHLENPNWSASWGVFLDPKTRKGRETCLVAPSCKLRLRCTTSICLRYFWFSLGFKRRLSLDIIFLPGVSTKWKRRSGEPRRGQVLAQTAGLVAALGREVPASWQSEKVGGFGAFEGTATSPWLVWVLGFFLAVCVCVWFCSIFQRWAAKSSQHLASACQGLARRGK